MDLQKMFMDELETKMANGEVKEKIVKAVDETINNTIKNLFTGFDGVGRKIEDKLKTQMCKQIEEYDFDKYLPKLELVLTECINNVTKDTKKVIKNFETFVKMDKIDKITLQEIFDRYKLFVSENVETYGLEVFTDDDPYYENVEVVIDINTEWGTKVITLRCRQDEDLTKKLELRTSSYREEYYLDYKSDTRTQLFTLRYLDEFDIYLIKLAKSYTNISKDLTIDEDEVEVEVKAEPEANFY